MPETLTEVPPEYRSPVANGEFPDYGTPEFTAELVRGYGPTEKAVADIAIESSGLVTTPNVFGEQLSIENEPGIQWPVTNAEKGSMLNKAPESNYAHPQDMSSLEEAKYTSDYITRSKAHEEWTSGKIDWEEFDKRTANKTPRTYQQPLLRQDGQVFAEEQPIMVDSKIGVGAEDGSFWHGTNQLMEPGDRLMPSGEVTDSVHRSNKLERSFTSSSSPNGTQYDNGAKGGEKEFAFGVPRDAGYLPTAYGEHIYKVSSPNTKIVQTSNGVEVWAEGGAKEEKLMHPDFARNYREAEAKVSRDRFQPGLPGMEKGMKFVPEADLEVSAKEFNDKHLRYSNETLLNQIPKTTSGPEDIALPGFEEYGKRRDIPASPSNSRIPQV